MTSTDTNFGLDLEKNQLRVVEWQHMDLKKFYPFALTSTWTVRCMLYPMSVVKARLQLQKQKHVYRGMTDAIRSIVKHEGFRALYRGFWVTVPQIGTSFIYTTTYEKLRHMLQYNYGIKNVALISSLAGGAASFASQAIFIPTDIIAQHLMIYNYADKFISGSDKKIIDYMRSNKGTLGLRAIRAVYTTDGLAGFYRFQDLFKLIHNDKSLLLIDQAIAAGLGGACSAIATNPMEVFRIRLQVHRTTYKETLARMIRNEGLSIFTKGLPPRLISNSIYSSVVMVGYEVVKRICVLPEYKHAVKW